MSIPRPDITHLAHEASKKAQAEAKRLNHLSTEPPRPLWPVVRPRGTDESASDAVERARRKIDSRIANIKATDRYKSGSLPDKV